MIDLKQLDLEYNNYQIIRKLYTKYKKEFEKFNQKNSEKLNSLLITYNSIKNIKRNSSRQDVTADKLLDDFINKNPLFGEWYELDCEVKKYKNKLQQHSFTTHAFMECSRFICLQHNDDEYDLIDLSTRDKLNLSQYDSDKQQYIINDLKSHHSFICYVTQKDLPLLMQVAKEVDKEIVYTDTDTEEEEEQKFWNEISRCYIIEKEFEKRKSLMSLNIDHERKLVELLGFNLIGPDKSNRWLITDENNNHIGFIQYKKLIKKNEKKGHPAIYGYHMEIENKDICYNATRKASDTIDLAIRFHYEFDIKRESGESDHIDINVGEYPQLTLWSKDYGFMIFKIDNQGLYLNFKSKTENFNVEENVIYQICDRQVSNVPNEYLYQLRYCDKSHNLDSDNQKGITIREILGSCTPYQQECGQINLVENTWIDNKLRTNRENIVAGTVEKMALKHQMGIDAFNHFRYLINQILPFKQEVVSAMLEQYLGNKEELALFIPELGKTIDEAIEQKGIPDCEEIIGLDSSRRKKSMELIANQEKTLRQQMQKLLEEEYEEEKQTMLEDENYNGEFNMILGPGGIKY